LPNGLPLDVFFPVEKRAARAALGLPLDGLLGLAAADYLVERRKGGDMISAALTAAARRPDFGLMTMGHARGLVIEGVRMHALGFVSDDTVKRLVYSAADLLIHPAPVDNLPNTIVEALACGTPTVGFRIGGVPEMVIPGETGWLCASLGADALGVQLRQALDQLAAGVRLSDLCRARAVANHDALGMARAYLALFKQVAS
jgi:glycosyltransferase involved in cell wall biosynthesis